MANHDASFHTRGMTVRSLLLALSAVCVMTGCGGGSGADAGQGVVLRSGHVRILVAGEGDGITGGGGYPGGTVTMAGRCLGLDSRPALWPHGTRIVSEVPLTIEVPGLGRLAVGDHVAEGAVADWSQQHLPEGINSMPAGCTRALIAYEPDP